MFEAPDTCCRLFLFAVWRIGFVCYLKGYYWAATRFTMSGQSSICNCTSFTSIAYPIISSVDELYLIIEDRLRTL